MHLLLPLSLLAAAPALAQDTSVPAVDEGFNALGFHIAPLDGDPRDPILVVRPGRFVQWEGYAGSIVSWSNQLLAWQPATGPEVTLLDDVVTSNFAAGLAVHDRVRLQLAAPVHFASTGQDGQNGRVMGDVRVGGMIALLRPQGEGFGLAVNPWLDLPTGDDQLFLGNAGVAGGLSLSASQDLERFTFSGDLGLQLNPEIALANVQNSDGILLGGAVGYLLTPTLGATLEARLFPALQRDDEAGANVPGEALISGRKRWDNGLHLDLGGARYLTSGTGVARHRAFIGLGWGQLYSDRDLDKDGLIDKEDACPTEPETVNQHKDKDGCPDQLAEVDVRVLKDGQPFAGAELTVRSPAGETMVGRVDRSSHTAVPGESWGAKASWGTCFAGEASEKMREGSNTINVPLKRSIEGAVAVTVTADGKPLPGATVWVQSDGNPECGTAERMTTDAEGKLRFALGAGMHTVIIEAPDAAPARRGFKLHRDEVRALDVALAPSKAKLEAKKIVILDKVFFATGKADILDASNPLLQEIADILLNNPQVKRVRIEGHTDDVGPDAANLKLSDARAAAVRAWLIAHGVAEDRLVSQGFGETKPLLPNKSAANRAQNRRVEFNILEPNVDPNAAPAAP